VLSALVAAMAPEHLRGTAFGVVGLITGLAALGASVLAGTPLGRDRPGSEVRGRRLPFSPWLTSSFWEAAGKLRLEP
jgi:hypothetical protein